MASSRSMLRLAVLAGVLSGLLVPTAAEAAIPNIPNGAGGNITCTVQSGANAGQRHCSGIFTTFDGAPIDINVGFPPAPSSGPDGNFPIVGMYHGWGGSKLGVTSGGWINDGYAVFSMSDRGWGNSCGGADPKRAQPVCAEGYNHLMDTRFEVRDAQEVFEALADRAAPGATGGEGLINPQRIGVTGGSYGGGISMALAALKNRKMIQDNDGTLVPWVSDGGKPMRIAAAQPDIPWTDLAYSLQPNGHTLDYVVDSPYLKRGRIGVMKQSWVALLYASGQALSNYAPAGTDPDADLITWYAAINAGEPYDDNPLSQDIVDEIMTHHSSYYIDDSTAPAPLLISNGFTDDLFPPDEAIRFYNRTRHNHPTTPISLMFTDHGHARGQNKAADGTFRSRQLHNWFDFYVKGVGSEPFHGVQTLTQTCGGPSGGATGPFDDPDTDLPFRAAAWSQLAPGEVRYSGPAAQTITPEASDQNGTTFDPNGGGGACATAPGADQAGTASYRLDPAPAGGFTLMGSPTIVADINSPGSTSQLAARLLDVDPISGDETLVARGIYRPEINSGTESTSQVFQLHPNGWKFETGHIAKLELLPKDQPYGRNSNGQAPVTVSNLELRLPVVEQPDGSLVQSPAPKIVPPGYELAQNEPAYDRPAQADQLSVALVPAFRQTISSSQCAARGGTDSLHGPPLAFTACDPPGYRPGTAAHLGPLASGHADLIVVRGDATTTQDEADIAISLSASDVRDLQSGGDYLPNASGDDVTLVSKFRLTDTLNGGALNQPATVTDFDFPVGVACAGTGGSAGAACNATTSADAVNPGAITEGTGMVLQVHSIRLNDSGVNAVPGGGDDRLFAQQGIYVP
jgi:hypothetical protein